MTASGVGSSDHSGIGCPVERVSSIDSPIDDVIHELDSGDPREPYRVGVGDLMYYGGDIAELRPALALLATRHPRTGRSSLVWRSLSVGRSDDHRLGTS
jgi:hypothetical protein